MKYIIFETIMDPADNKTRKPESFPVIFPEDVLHFHMAHVVDYLLNKQYRKHMQVASAGEYNISTGETYGQSETLNLKPRPQDASIIKNYKPSYPYA